MTIFSFFLIYFIITLCVGIVIIALGRSSDSDMNIIIGLLITIFCISSLLATIKCNNQTLISNYAWWLYGIPVLCLIISTYKFITNEHISFWKGDYYKEYHSIMKDYYDLLDKFNSLEQQLNKERISHEIEIQKILKNKPLEVKQSNIKLHI